MSRSGYTVNSWPPYGYRIGTQAEVNALAGRAMPNNTTYAVPASVEVECRNGHKFAIPMVSMYMHQCPFCWEPPWFPQLSLDLDPRRDDRERAERSMLSWPSVATRDDWQLRNRYHAP